MATLDNNVSLVSKVRSRLSTQRMVQTRGRVTQMIGLVIESQGPTASVGEMCRVVSPGRPDGVLAEVVGFRDQTALMMPLGDVGGIEMGSTVTPRRSSAMVPVGDAMLGRVFDGLGNPLDDAGPVDYTDHMPLYADPINPLRRRAIDEPAWMGIKAID